MNFSQKLGIFCLIIITVAYIYFAFFSENGVDFDRLKNINKNENTNNISLSNENQNPEEQQIRHEVKNIKICVTDQKGNLRFVSRKCDTASEKSCFAYAISELIKAPSDWEKNKGLSSEIPSDTKILSVREDDNNILIDLSPAFESGGGAESTEIRIRQLIKTSLANTKLPVYLYINGKQANVIGGEGIMLKQPLTERSLDD